MSLVEIEPGGRIPVHDETPRDQEEVYVVLGGDAVAVIDGVEHPAPAGTYVRLDPQPLRTIANVGSEPRSPAHRLGATLERLRVDGLGATAPGSDRRPR